MSQVESTPKSEVLLSAARERRRERGIVDVDEAQIKMVVFRCGARRYAFYGSQVREILPPREIAWAPGLPPHLPGLINVRGEIESVIDLRCILEGERNADCGHCHIAIAVAGEFISGVLIDQVEDVMDIPQSAVKPAPGGLPDAVRELVAGEFEYQGETVVLLDMHKLAAKVTL